MKKTTSTHNEKEVAAYIELREGEVVETKTVWRTPEVLLKVDFGSEGEVLAIEIVELCSIDIGPTD